MSEIELAALGSNKRKPLFLLARNTSVMLNSSFSFFALRKRTNKIIKELKKESN
jgi:hypothetical protein